MCRRKRVFISLALTRGNFSILMMISVTCPEALMGWSDRWVMAYRCDVSHRSPLRWAAQRPPAELPCGCAACYHIIVLSLFSECLRRVYSAVCVICYAKFTSYRILPLFLVAMKSCRRSWIVLPVQYALLFLLSELEMYLSSAGDPLPFEHRWQALPLPIRV